MSVIVTAFVTLCHSMHCYHICQTLTACHRLSQFLLSHNWHCGRICHSCRTLLPLSCSYVAVLFPIYMPHLSNVCLPTRLSMTLCILKAIHLTVKALWDVDFQHYFNVIHSSICHASLWGQAIDFHAFLRGERWNWNFLNTNQICCKNDFIFGCGNNIRVGRWNVFVWNEVDHTRQFKSLTGIYFQQASVRLWTQYQRQVQFICTIISHHRIQSI